MHHAPWCGFLQLDAADQGARRGRRGVSAKGLQPNRFPPGRPLTTHRPADVRNRLAGFILGGVSRQNSDCKSMRTQAGEAARHGATLLLPDFRLCPLLIRGQRRASRGAIDVSLLADRPVTGLGLRVALPHWEILFRWLAAGPDAHACRPLGQQSRFARRLAHGSWTGIATASPLGCVQLIAEAGAPARHAAEVVLPARLSIQSGQICACCSAAEFLRLPDVAAKCSSRYLASAVGRARGRLADTRATSGKTPDGPMRWRVFGYSRIG